MLGKSIPLLGLYEDLGGQPPFPTKTRQQGITAVIVKDVPISTSIAVFEWFIGFWIVSLHTSTYANTIQVVPLNQK